MGYTTEFRGSLSLSRNLTEDEKKYINLISSTRRMKRDVNKLMELYDGKHGNPFATEKQAKSALVMAQLSQLKKVYNGDWEADWNNCNQHKHVILRSSDKLYKHTKITAYHFLAFKSEEIRNEFLKNFEQLIRDYFEL